MIITRRAHPHESDRIVAFYHDNDYRSGLNPADILVAAENEGALYGAVRL
jgi:hypothetical protein